MNVKLSDEARDALAKLAVDERRDTRRQAEYLIEAELERRGLLHRTRPERLRTKISTGATP